MVFLTGAKSVDAHIMMFFVEEQIEQAVAAGRDREDFEISEQELLGGLSDVVNEFREKNPGVGFYEAIRVQLGFGQEQFLRQRRASMVFDKLFFPGPASEWPELTREAIMASSGGGDGKAFWDNLVKASVGPDGETRELPAFWMQLCRGWVTRQLKSWSDIRYPSDGLAPEYCLEVNDRRLSTADAYEGLKATIYVQDMERAMAEVVVREALRQELVKQGAYLSDEDFRAQFDEYRAPYDGTPFNTEVIATAFKGYPSLEAFRARWRLIKSFENMIQADLNDENLQAHASEFGAFFADGQVNVDLIQCMGRSLQTGAWLPDGMTQARERAEMVMAKIESEELTFDQAKQQYGQYYKTDKDQGRLGSKPLNQLRQAVRESEFTDLITGSSVATYLYYEAEPGQVVGPLRGTDAWWVARVNSRTPPRSQVSVSDERTRELVRQDYVNHRFLQWANEVIARTEVQ